MAVAEIENTLVSLPKPLRDRAKKLPITFERIRGIGLCADGIEPDTLGLFAGAEFIERDHVTMSPQIILFLENLWNYAERDEKVFEMEIRTIFLHELGHYFGLNEENMVARGLD